MSSCIATHHIFSPEKKKYIVFVSMSYSYRVSPDLQYVYNLSDFFFLICVSLQSFPNRISSIYPSLEYIFELADNLDKTWCS